MYYVLYDTITFWWCPVCGSLSQYYVTVFSYRLLERRETVKQPRLNLELSLLPLWIRDFVVVVRAVVAFSCPVTYRSPFNIMTRCMMSKPCPICMTFTISTPASFALYAFFLVPDPPPLLPPSPVASFSHIHTHSTNHTFFTKCSLSSSSQCVQPRPCFSPRCTQISLSPSQLTVVCRSRRLVISM